MIGWVNSKVRGFAIAAAALFAVILRAYWQGRNRERSAQQERELNAYVETRKRIDQVDIGDADTAREWLRNRKRK